MINLIDEMRKGFVIQVLNHDTNDYELLMSEGDKICGNYDDLEPEDVAVFCTNESAKDFITPVIEKASKYVNEIKEKLKQNEHDVDYIIEEIFDNFLEDMVDKEEINNEDLINDSLFINIFCGLYLDYDYYKISEIVY